MSIGSASWVRSSVWTGTLVALTVGWFVVGAVPAHALEAFDGRIQAHGFAEMQVRGMSEKYGINHNELDLAQWYNVLNVELEFDIFPDGWGPIDLMSAFVRLEGRYDCVYSHGCAMFKSTNPFGNDSQRLPRRLRDAEDPDFAGVIKVGPPINRIQNKTAARLGGLREKVVFGDLLVDDPDGVIVMDDVHVFPNPNGNIERDGVTYTWDRTGAAPDTIDGVHFTPNQFFQGLAYSTGTVKLGGANNPDPAKGFAKCDPSKGCPGVPGQELPLELNPIYQHKIIESLGFPGFEIFNDIPGADGIPNTADDPGVYVLGELRNYRFGLKDVRGPSGGAGTTQILGPWLPKNFIQARAQAFDKANPLRGREAPSQYTATGTSFHQQRFYTLSHDLASLPAGDPRRSLFFLGSDPSDGFTSLVDPTPEEISGLFVDQFLEDGVTPNPLWTDYYFRAPRDDAFFFGNGIVQSSEVQKFGGDYSGVIPCTNPDRGAFIPSDNQNQLTGFAHNNGCLDFRNIRVTGGTGELPLRPAPDRSNLFSDFDPLYAQGLYIPSSGVLKYIRNGGDWDNHGYNVDQNNRAWNRGQAQEDNKELKEAYIDAEFFDSRLWIRAGLQNIVWGKTELFPTTDQFNPLDIALAGVLAGLEESRIALWSARFVYSLYNVGPLEDVRIEFATNLDDYEPIDLGACGEAFTINVVCSITTGLFAHGILGIGIAGIDRPPSFWKDIGSLEFGGRVEWRWDRFSFALIDFYGYDDFPFADAINYFDRSVEFGLNDSQTLEFGPGAGRPLASGFSSGCSGLWGGSGQGVWASANRNPRDYASMSQAGIGRDPACLKPGGAAGGLNQNGFTVARDEAGEVQYFRTDGFGNPLPGPDSKFITNGVDTWYTLFEFERIPCATPDEFADCEPARYEVGLAESTFNGNLFKDGLSPQNALENHTANQQSFAWICAATLTIGAALDPGACAFNLFGSPALLDKNLAPFPFVEIVSCLMAGDVGGTCNGFMSTISNNVQGFVTRRESGIVPLNRDPHDGLITATTPLINRDQNPISGTSNFALFAFSGGTFLPGDEDILTLDSTLTTEQRALLGCGPFFGTRCDTGVTSSGGPFGVNPCSAFGSGCTAGGGLDFLNMEGSVLLQSFVGIEGSDLSDPFYTGNPLFSQWAAGGANFAGTPYAEDGIWLTTSGLPQPGTMDFQGGPVCTRWVKELNDTVVLPGCRGINGVMNRETARQDHEVVFYFDDGYDPKVDGCILGQSIDGVPVRGIHRDGSSVDLSPCIGSTHKTGGYYAWRIGNTDASHPGQALPQLIDWDGKPASTSQARLSRPGSGTLWHPFAGCFANPSQAVAGVECVQIPQEDINDIANPSSPNYNPLLAARLSNGGGAFDPVSGRFLGGTKIQGDVPRDFEAAFFIPSGEINIGGATVFGFNLQSQIFRSELAAFSWNFMQFLIQASCDKDEEDIFTDPECFNPNNQFAVGKCSYVTPQLCTNVKGFFGAAGVQRNTVRAGGNERFGRRTFLWHSGGELNLKYQQRNVLGFSMDFGEDRSKSNWGIEFTYVSKQNFFNNNDFTDNVTTSSVFNLTISVDRPTFINFLNQNRTFFMNSQWFFQYIPKYDDGFTSTGPLNVLFTTAIFTGYFQDRLNPTFVTVYDFRSRSGGILPSVQYRFTEALSVGVGMNFFFGQTRLVDMAVREFAPAGNRAGKIAYKDGVDNAISSFRDKDEIWLKLRWTF